MSGGSAPLAPPGPALTLTLTLALALGLGLAGCALGPDYVRPTAPVPESFRGAAAAQERQASFADLPFWELFQDPALVALLREGLAGSYDLQAAVARVEAAREAAGIAESARWPALSAQVGVGYQQIFSPFVVTSGTGQGPRFASYQLTAAVSWELDLWGRLRRLKESALADYLATEEVQRGVVVSLIGDVAQGYFDLLALDLQLQIARETEQSRAKTVELFRVLEQGGTGNRLQTAAAEANRAGAAATIPAIERQIAAAENRLSLLLGRTPGPIARPADLLRRPAPPRRPVGVPGALLERRPDIRQAEARLVSANAQVGAAYAARLPQLTLSLTGGLESSSLGELFSGGAVTYAAGLLGSFLAPIFNGAQLTHRYRAQQASFRAAVALYRGAVLNALSEVSSLVVAGEKLRESRIELEKLVSARREAVTLSHDRFTNGVASYLEVVNAEQNLFPAELQLAQTIGAQFVVEAQLYRALGGGWRAAAPPPAPPPRPDR